MQGILHAPNILHFEYIFEKTYLTGATKKQWLHQFVKKDLQDYRELSIT